jgi:hypothetical protein
MVRTNCHGRYVHYNEVKTFLEQLTTPVVRSLGRKGQTKRLENCADVLPETRREYLLSISRCRTFGDTLS